ncbi:hypothetical protein BDB01DRAFT_700128, partial [Pilobolus umbonatus]
VNAHDKRIFMDTETHRCPRCKEANSVSLTRCESELILFNKRYELPRHHKQRYECHLCKWKNAYLDED